MAKEEGAKMQYAGNGVHMIYEFFEKHHDFDGFWEDVDWIGPHAGANVGYKPTGSSLTPMVGYLRQSSTSLHLDGIRLSRCAPNNFLQSTSAL